MDDRIQTHELRVENEALAAMGVDFRVGDVVIVRMAGFGPVEGTVIGVGTGRGPRSIAVGLGPNRGDFDAAELRKA